MWTWLLLFSKFSFRNPFSYTTWLLSANSFDTPTSATNSVRQVLCRAELQTNPSLTVQWTRLQQALRNLTKDFGLLGGFAQLLLDSALLRRPPDTPGLTTKLSAYGAAMPRKVRSEPLERKAKTTPPPLMGKRRRRAKNVLRMRERWEYDHVYATMLTCSYVGS